MSELNIVIDNNKDLMDKKLDITPPSSSSKDDETRKELLWESREEEVLHKWKDEMYLQSKAHRENGKKYKKLYALCGVPATLIPIVLSSFQNEIDEYPIVQSMLLLATGFFVGISTFFNLGKRFSQHFEYENRYDELAREMDKELSKPKRHRIACDVYMEKMYMKYTGLNKSAPLVATIITKPRRLTNKKNKTTEVEISV